jgi:hypothetical protein
MRKLVRLLLDVLQSTGSAVAALYGWDVHYAQLQGTTMRPNIEKLIAFYAGHMRDLPHIILQVGPHHESHEAAPRYVAQLLSNGYLGNDRTRPTPLSHEGRTLCAEGRTVPEALAALDVLCSAAPNPFNVYKRRIPNSR